MDWLHPDHGEKKYGLVASRPSRKEKWKGKMDSSEMKLTLFLFPEPLQDAAETYNNHEIIKSQKTMNRTSYSECGRQWQAKQAQNP